MKRAVRIFVPIILILAVIAAIIAVNYNTILAQSYPKRYTEYVEAAAKEFSVDENLIYAIIKTESGFDPDVVSAADARGLMQLTEETFDWIKSKLGDDAAVYNDMFDPQTNIRYGTFLMSYLLEEFGSVRTAAAAYHAGRGAVNGWLKDRSYSTDGATLNDIPISDTDHYVDKIEDSYAVYKKLYNQN